MHSLLTRNALIVLCVVRRFLSLTSTYVDLVRI